MSQKRKLIGIPGFQNSEKMFGVTGNYMQFANRFGDVRIIMPHEEFVEVDLLILPGGLDLSPSAYGKIPGYQNTNHDVFKEFFFKERLKTYVNKGTPIFGICLGFQMLNVFFGGTLTQHLLAHEQSSSRWALAHDIIVPQWVKKDSKEKVIKDSGKHKVNSHHHQAVLDEDLANSLTAIAYSDTYEVEGKIIECFMHKELKIAGVQFHPEEMVNEPLSKTIIESFLK